MKRFSFALVCLVAVMLACAIPVETTVPAAAPTATRSDPSPIAATRSKTPTATRLVAAEVTAFEALHVRAEPSHQAAIVDYLYVGEEVTLTGKCSEDPYPPGWAEIEWKGSTAWVRAKFLSDNKCKE